MPNPLRAAHHPWPCLLFLAPLLAVYEYGVIAFGGGRADAMRNGADSWIRGALAAFGVQEVLAAPVFILVALAALALWKWNERPADTPGVLFTMIVESIAYGIGLWLISRGFVPFLQSVGITVGVQIRLTDESIANLVTFIGAGIYEEAIFRVLLLGALVYLLRTASVPRGVALPFAAAVSAVTFAAAHHFGEYGEHPVNRTYFLFRVTAGLYFAAIYWLRGFGVAVGAHALYDVLVGIPWQATEY